MSVDIEPTDSRWRLDKRVPVPLLLALVLQTVGAVWWAATLNARVAVLEEKTTISSGQPERLVRVETQVESLIKSTDRIERKLDAALEPNSTR